jgi:hypothetical protein
LRAIAKVERAVGAVQALRLPGLLAGFFVLTLAEELARLGEELDRFLAVLQRAGAMDVAAQPVGVVLEQPPARVRNGRRLGADPVRLVEPVGLQERPALLEQGPRVRRRRLGGLGDRGPPLHLVEQLVGAHLVAVELDVHVLHAIRRLPRRFEVAGLQGVKAGLEHLPRLSFLVRARRGRWLGRCQRAG